ncbi:MAG TPA: cob(I)yrinic acid a,c-diamide adenosyltransferase [Pirellulales bacterium]|nr:cob(I)yrinic acid a,c-diamide adenosyltransferase [Pirellulales bacterium]
MKIYTKTGDGGETGLFGGPRVRKDNPRIEAYGTVDELNAVLGLVRCEALPAEIDMLVARVQNELFDLGAELATPEPARMGTSTLGAGQIAALEQAIDRYEAGLPTLRQFILPGGARPAAALHLARTVCRRAERRLISLAAIESVSRDLVVYLNRLGDLLFVLARAVNQAAGIPDVPWKKAEGGGEQG